MSPWVVIVVHGIWDSAARMEPLCRGLEARGVTGVDALDLRPNSGAAPIAALAAQVAERVRHHRRTTPKVRFQCVGFSMGALVTRYYLHRLREDAEIGCFVSISGPHHGTLTAYGLPLAGVREMRPGSALLRALEAEPSPFDTIALHTLWTPYDLMIVPGRSGQLVGAASDRRFEVKMHRFMVRDPAVLDHVAGLLHKNREGHR